MKREKTWQKKTSPMYIVCFIILCIYFLFLVFPLLWGIFVSFIPSASYMQYRTHPFQWPSKMTFQNYVHGFEAFKIVPDGQTEPIGFGRIFLYSILYAGGCALTSTLSPFVVAYLSARYDYKFSKFVYALVVFVMAVPLVGTMTSEIVVTKQLGLFDHIWGMWILRFNFFTIYFLVFYAIFKQVPKDYTEAAKIDGLNDFAIMVKVIFPFASGTFGIVYLLNFISYWNDFQIPNYYLPSFPVAGYSIFYFANNSNALVYTDPKTGFSMQGYLPQLFAMILLIALPVIILAIVFNKKLMSNLNDGGIKG